MALFHSPQIVTDNLILSYDVGNRKSYLGPPIQNKLTSISPMTTSGTGYSFIGGAEVSDIPSIGPTLVQYSNIQNNYSAVSTWCCPSPFSYGSDISVSGSTLYTYAIVYRVESGYTNANYMYRYEYNVGTYVTESGVHSDSNRVHLGNGWYWAWGTFTTQASTTRLLGLASFYYRYSTSYDKLSVAKVLLVQGDYTGLHPKYWPEVSTTRSAVLTNQSNQSTTFTPSNMVYSNAGVPSFSESAGSTIVSNLPIGSTLPALSSFTLEAWVKVTAWPTNTPTNGYGSNIKAGTIVGGCYYAGTGIRWAGNASGNGMTVFGFVRGADAYRYTTAYTVPALNVYNHYVFTNNSAAGGMNFYVNGVLQATTTAATQQYDPTLVSGCGNITINRADIDGGGTAVYSYMNGNIDAVKVYTKALTSAEVQNNYNALKGRFGQ
jgi:hypothetical protein